MFVSRLSLHVLVGVGIAVTGIVATLGSARAASPSPARVTPKPHISPVRTLHLRNSSWREIRVEARTGPHMTCDSLGSLGVQVLRQGQEWEVQFDDAVICWRRDQTPGDPTSRWSDWYQLRLADGETRDVSL